MDTRNNRNPNSKGTMDVNSTKIIGNSVINSNKNDTYCSARDWERSGLLEENPQSGCTEICASLKGPL
jgi:hypothetical protein